MRGIQNPLEHSLSEIVQYGDKILEILDLRLLYSRERRAEEEKARVSLGELLGHNCHNLLSRPDDFSCPQWELSSSPGAALLLSHASLSRHTAFLFVP